MALTLQLRLETLLLKVYKKYYRRINSVNLKTIPNFEVIRNFLRYISIYCFYKIINLTWKSSSSIGIILAHWNILYSTIIKSSSFKILLSMIYERGAIANWCYGSYVRLWLSGNVCMYVCVPASLVQVRNYTWESLDDDTDFPISQDVDQRAFATSLGFPSPDWRPGINMPETTPLRTSIAERYIILNDASSTVVYTMRYSVCISTVSRPRTQFCDFVQRGNERVSKAR